MWSPSNDVNIDLGQLSKKNNIRTKGNQRPKHRDQNIN